MKTQIRSLFSLLVLAALVACSSSNGSGNAGSPPAPIPPDRGGPGGGTGGGTPPLTEFPVWTEGATVDLYINSSEVMEQYKGAPGNFPRVDDAIIARLNVVLKQTGTGRYSGYLKIAYKEMTVDGKSIVRVSQFTSGESEGETQYNAWLNFGAKAVFRAFFEDPIDMPFGNVNPSITAGGILIVVDEVQTGNLMNGRIYFHNFAKSYAPKMASWPTQRCWRVKVGPYDCRDFLVNGEVAMASSIYPTRRGQDGQPYYTELGDFMGMDGTKAFTN